MRILKTTAAALAVAAMCISPVVAHPVAKADVDGALAGAEIGAFFGPEGALIGAIIGAVASSLAEAAIARGPSLDNPRLISVWDPTGGNCGDILIPRPFGCGGIRNAGGPVFSAKTPATEAGYWHNRIVKAYMAENRKFDKGAFEKLAIRELGLAAAIAKDPRLKKLVTASASPGSGDKQSPWGIYLTEQAFAIMDGSSSAPEKGKALAELERKFLSEHGKDEGSRIAIQVAVSIAKHSNAFWNNAQSIVDGNCMIEPTRCGTLPALSKK